MCSNGQATLSEGGVLAEIVNEDGSMSRLPQLMQFARLHRLPIVTIRDLIAYREMLEVSEWAEGDLFVF